MRARGFRVRKADWSGNKAAIRQVRDEVFVREQAVPLEQEWDKLDATCLHVLAFDMLGKPIGTGRLLETGQIGRMAVLADWRGSGVGSALLEQLLAEAHQRGLQQTFLHAQTHAIAFYSRHGFVVHGAEFMDANIPHRHMTRRMQ